MRVPRFDNHLFGVACTSGINCFAVGNYFDGSVYKTLIEHWIGGGWTIMESPNAGTANNVLNSATCASTNDCWAVGTFYGSSPIRH